LGGGGGLRPMLTLGGGPEPVPLGAGRGGTRFLYTPANQQVSGIYGRVNHSITYESPLVLCAAPAGPGTLPAS